MVEDALKTLGFTEKEQKLYLLILKHRRITPAELARISRVNRTTVYAIAKSLVAKGIIAEDLGGKSLYLVPASAEELRKLTRKEEREAKVKEKAIGRLIEHLSLAQVGAEYPVPKIRFVEDAGIEDYLYDNLKKWNESIKKADGVWWGFQDNTLVENYREWIGWFWKNTPSSIELKLLSNRSDVEKRLAGKYMKRHIKFWDKGGSFTATTWIAGDYMVLLETSVKPFYLIELHDALLAHNQREIFKNLWDTI